MADKPLMPMLDLVADETVGKAARNERRKAFANLLNAIAVAAVIAALVQPVISGRLHVTAAAAALASFVVLQFALHYVLGRVED